MFPDLRPISNGDSSSGFWPTFTDIMTVIMMIFLMAFLALFSRNSDLVRELTSALAKTEQVEEVARLTEEQKNQLETDLLSERARLNSIRIDLAAAEKKLEATRRKAEVQQQQAESEIQRLALMRAQLNEELSTSRREYQSASEALTDSLSALSLAQLEAEQFQEEELRLNERILAINEEKANLVEEYQDLENRFDDIQKEAAARDAKLSEAELSRNRLISELSRLTGVEPTEAANLTDTELMDNISSHLAFLRGQSSQLASEVASLERQQQLSNNKYNDLKSRYDELVKPARSTKDKRVVEVRYFLEGGEERYSIVEQKGLEERVSYQELQQRLEAHRAVNPNTLYVKIVIPDNSGLSFEEAWRFTNETLNKYDYYYR